ncbi:MAG: adenylate/guanylate cyclase domain-containing protein [Pseudomonadota bacterium]
MMQPGEEPQERPLRRLTSVLAADLCGYAAFVEKDEDNAIDLIGALRGVVETQTEKFRGRIFHIAADGFLVEFPSARDCLSAAFGIMAAITDSKSTFFENSAKLRIGLHVGDVVDQPDGDLLGHGVNVAARLQQNAEPGQVLVSEHFANLVAAASDGQFTKKGAVQLKNIKEPIVTFEASVDPKRSSLLDRMPWIKSVAAIMLLCAVLVGGYGAFAPTPAEPLDRRAIESATEVLVQSNLPVDAAISALIETASFDAAIQSILDEVSATRDDISVQRRAELLHQAGALAFHHDRSTAQRVYRQIHAALPDDWVAALQLARIHLDRSERAEAAKLIEAAITHPQLTNEQTLLIEIEQVRANAPPYDRSAEALSQISKRADAAGFTSVGLRAASYATTHEYASIWAQRDPTESELNSLVMQIGDIIERQVTSSSYGDLARSYSLRASLHFSLEDYARALTQYEAVAEMEEALARPHGQLRMLSNIARAHLKLGNLRQADKKNNEAIRFGVEQDLIMTAHFNMALSAEIAIASEKYKEGCARLQEAKEAWPPSQDWPSYLVDLNRDADCFQ